MGGRRWIMCVTVAGAFLLTGTACDSEGSTGTGQAKPASSKPAKSIEEREAGYAADLPPDLIDKAGVQQLTTIGYDVCRELKDGDSDGSVLNDLKNRDAIWLGLYGKDVMAAAKTHLCES